jgi:hypothetical protein
MALCRQKNPERIGPGGDRSVIDELVDYIRRAHTWSPRVREPRRQSVSLPHDYTPDLAGIEAPSC